ncbi:MAG: FG-GAP repeat protein [Bacteroidota bacterium]
MKQLLPLLLLSMMPFFCLCQRIGIGTTSPNPSAILDMNSDNKGMLMPRMTTAQRKTIATPAQGLMVFDIDKSAIYLYDGTKWVPMLFSANENLVPPVTRQASDAVTGNYLGHSVGISGDYAVVGLQPNANAVGAAYIFFRNAGVWQQQAKLIASDGFTGNCFGVSVGISGNEVIVGAGNSSNGKAYVFSRSGTNWTETAKLSANDGAPGDHFGHSVSISGNYAIVGAPYQTVSGNANQGSAYIFFRNTGWITGQAHQARLLAPDGAIGDIFGKAVSISGDYAIIGAPADDAEYSNQGAAYVYGRVGGNWPNLAKLKGLLSPNRWFGSSVSISGDYAIVGAPYELVPIYESGVTGSAYIFYGGAGWSTGQSPQATLFSSNNNTLNDRFGSGVHISGDYAIVGAWSYDSPGNLDQGNACLYKRNGTSWLFVRRVDDNSGETGGLFGWSVGISGFNVVIGATGKNAGKGELHFLNVE